MNIITQPLFYSNGSYYQYIKYPGRNWRLYRILQSPISPPISLNIVPFTPTLNSTSPNPGTHCVYLLRSLNPRYSRRTYIGYTVNPERRIRQHNGEIVGGAKRTIRARPWKMVCYIEGFPNQRTGLQYEWINNHPSTKRWNVKGRLKTLAETLLKERFTKTAPLSRDLDLTIHWLESGHSLPFTAFGSRCPNYCREINNF